MNEDEIGVDVVVDDAEEESVEIQNDILKGEKGDPGEDGVSPTVTTSKTGKVTTITITDKDGTQTATINDGEDGSDGQDGQDGVGIESIELTSGSHQPGTLDTYTITYTNTNTDQFQVYNGADGGGSGNGDMLKSVYDTNDNGIVDNAEKVNNHTVNKDVPSNAVFTDTIYDDTALAGRVSALESGKQDVLNAGTNINISNNTISTSAEPNALEAVKVNGVTQTITNKAIDINETKIADKYSDSSTYAVGDYCIYNNTLYICNTTISTAEAFDSTKWTEISVTSKIKSNTNLINANTNSINAHTLDIYLLDGRIDVLEDKNIILAEMNGHWNISANNTYVKIPFSVTVNQVGNKLTNNNGVITIGAGISCVKVTVRLGIVKSSAGLIYSKILHTHNGSVSSDYTANQYVGANQRGGINTEYLYSVSEGDTIQIQTYGSTSDVVTGGSGISYLIVEAIKQTPGAGANISAD